MESTGTGARGGEGAGASWERERGLLAATYAG